MIVLGLSKALFWAAPPLDILEQHVQHLEEDHKALQRWLHLLEAQQHNKEVSDGHPAQNP